MKEQINAILAKVSPHQICPDSIDAKKELAGLGIGYFVMVDLVVVLEQELQADILDEDWCDWVTVADVYKHFEVAA